MTSARSYFARVVARGSAAPAIGTLRPAIQGWQWPGVRFGPETGMRGLASIAEHAEGEGSTNVRTSDVAPRFSRLVAERASVAEDHSVGDESGGSPATHETAARTPSGSVQDAASSVGLNVRSSTSSRDEHQSDGSTKHEVRSTNVRTSDFGPRTSPGAIRQAQRSRKPGDSKAESVPDRESEAGNASHFTLPSAPVQNAASSVGLDVRPSTSSRDGHQPEGSPNDEAPSANGRRRTVDGKPQMAVGREPWAVSRLETELQPRPPAVSPLLRAAPRTSSEKKVVIGSLKVEVVQPAPERRAELPPRPIIISRHPSAPATNSGPKTRFGLGQM